MNDELLFFGTDAELLVKTLKDSQSTFANI
jgi:hypothetical protein